MEAIAGSNIQNIQLPANQQISNDIDINQKKLELYDSVDPRQYLVTSILIYSAQYYPNTKTLLAKSLDKILQSTANECRINLNLLLSVTKILGDDVLRQIIYGPSAAFLPPSQIPHFHRLDMSLNCPENDNFSLQTILTAHQQLELQQIIPKNRVKQLIWYSRRKTLSNSTIVNNRFHSKQLRNELEMGQNWIDATPLAGLFLVLKETWRQIISKIENKKQYLEICQQFRIQFARFSFLHNKILSNPVKDLADDVFHNYETYIKNLIIQNANEKPLSAKHYVQILIEYSYCLLFYYKYKKCQKLMNKCCQILQLQLQYTGKLGRRTKYQSFDTAQLVMNLRKRIKQIITQDKNQMDKQQEEQADKLILPNAKQLLIQEIEKSTIKTQSTQTIKQSFYDDESILLEKPKFVQEVEQEKQTFVISQQKILTALAMINYSYVSVPHDQMLFQYISASVMAMLESKSKVNYTLQYSLLLLRSLNDFPRIKHAQRAIQQLQTLKLQYQRNIYKNVDCMFSTPYLTRFQFIKKLSSNYIDMSLVLTGVQLLRKVGMYEECIDGLIQKQYKQKALQLANQVLEQKGKTPRLLCMLGDIHQGDSKYYQQAWQLSQHRYARAQRSLGWIYFNNDEFEKAAQAFTLATNVSYYNPNTWFTLGCCYLRLSNFQKALRPFGQSIRIDDTQGEAWGNIASCYMHLKKPKQAYSTLQQAVKHAQGNWKLWSNLLTVALTLKQFNKFFQCIERIVRLGHQQIITKQIFNKISSIMKFKLYQCIDGGRKRVVFTFRRRIDRLFAYLQQKIGENPLVWQAKTSYLIVMMQYYTQMYKHYRKLHNQNKIDVNDLIQGYQTPQGTNQLTQYQIFICKQKIVEGKQTQLNMVMKIGWDQNKIDSVKVKLVVPQYIALYNQYSDKSDKNDFQLFIKGIKYKLEKCLEETINFDDKLTVPTN